MSLVLPWPLLRLSKRWAFLLAATLFCTLKSFQLVSELSYSDNHPGSEISHAYNVAHLFEQGVQTPRQQVRVQPTRVEPIRNVSLASIPLVLQPNSSIYKISGNWDAAPIVVKDFKLVFFTVPKAACTVFKQLFQTMMGLNRTKDPHNPSTNGLRYLFHYSLEGANYMLTSPHWTKALFVREPKQRMLSAYLDKVARKNATYVVKHCCHRKQRPCRSTTSWPPTWHDFVRTIAPRCPDPHWRPQSRRMESVYWKYINFVGDVANPHDWNRFLERIGATDLGSSGWGPAGTQSIVDSRARHATDASDKLAQFFNSGALEQQVEYYYRRDYNNPLFPNWNRSWATAL